MKYLTPFIISSFFPTTAIAHPGHDQSFTFIHSLEASGIIFATIIAAGLIIHYLTAKK